MLKKKFSKKIYPPNKGSLKWQNCFFSGVKQWYLSDAAKPCVLLVRAFPIEHGLFGMFCQLRPGLYCCFFGPYGESTLYQSEALPVQLLEKKKGYAPSKYCLHCRRHPSLSLSLAQVLILSTSIGPMSSTSIAYHLPTFLSSPSVRYCWPIFPFWDIPICLSLLCFEAKV